ncbi:hypothetical protein K438DRAFT_426232 [Mycena galopus ATCC 62051]|nr:hypothetical protein K438DRAFT_426232 [Mycena galopus ATCC 62051]
MCAVQNQNSWLKPSAVFSKSSIRTPDSSSAAGVPTTPPLGLPSPASSRTLWPSRRTGPISGIGGILVGLVVEIFHLATERPKAMRKQLVLEKIRAATDQVVTSQMLLDIAPLCESTHKHRLVNAPNYSAQLYTPQEIPRIQDVFDKFITLFHLSPARMFKIAHTDCRVGGTLNDKPLPRLLKLLVGIACPRAPDLGYDMLQNLVPTPESVYHITMATKATGADINIQIGGKQRAVFELAMQDGEKAAKQCEQGIYLDWRDPTTSLFWTTASQSFNARCVQAGWGIRWPCKHDFRKRARDTLQRDALYLELGRLTPITSSYKARSDYNVRLFKLLAHTPYMGKKITGPARS